MSDPTPAPTPSHYATEDSDSGSSVATLSDPTPADVSEQTGAEDIKTVVAPANQGFVQEAFDEQLDAAEAEIKFNDPKEGPEFVERDFTIVTHLDPARQRDPNGVYLDDLQRQQAEIIRARIEGRAPDLDNPGTTAGDVVVPTVQAKVQSDGNAHVPVSFTQDVLVGSPATEAVEDDDSEDDE